MTPGDARQARLLGERQANETCLRLAGLPEDTYAREAGTYQSKLDHRSQGCAFSSLQFLSRPSCRAVTVGGT